MKTHVVFGLAMSLNALMCAVAVLAVLILTPAGASEFELIGRLAVAGIFTCGARICAGIAGLEFSAAKAHRLGRDCGHAMCKKPSGSLGLRG